jgi:hypothetical protein
MRSEAVTFGFRDGKAYALVGGEVVASAQDLDELEVKLADKGLIDKEPPGDIHTDDGLIDKEPPGDIKGTGLIDKKPGEKKKTHVVTPNGIKGRILGQYPDTWGEMVSVRLENGRIAHLRVSDDTQFISEEETSDDPVVNLQVRLEKAPDEGSRDSLEERQGELESIKQEARHHIIAGTGDEEKLDEISITAEYELGEVHDALAALDDEKAQGYAPPTPMLEGVSIQEPMGHGDGGSWLQRTVDDMIQEAEQYDYQKLMDEGPEEFVAELETPALADGGVVRQMASSFIREKTAAAHPSIREKYESTWLQRVEECRGDEVQNRKTATKKEAAEQKDEHANWPDDILFT